MTPGPSSYSLNYSFVKTATIALKIGTSGRNSIRKEETLPGPGAYENDSLKRFGRSGPMVTMQGRPTRKQDGTSPGPNSYRCDINAVRSTHSGVRIGSSERVTSTQEI